MTKAVEDAGLARPLSPSSPGFEETLWEFLHRRDLEWKDTAGNILIPVLVFDQFEEIFTLGDAPALRSRCLPFFPELADLIENRPPASLERKLEDEPKRIDTILFAQKKYDEALQAWGDARDVFEHLVAKVPDNPSYQSSLVEIYNNTAWAFLLAQRPKEAIGAASKGVELDPANSSLKINLAHGYLLAGQFEKAKAIYLENKEVKLPDGRGFADVVLKDFKDLREAGVAHRDIKRIERLLSGEASGKIRK